MPKVLITTVPFGEKDRKPLSLLEDAGLQYLINPYNRKLTEDQLADIVTDFDVIIAGTEPITEKIMKYASNLKLISRVGIGLDSVDLIAAKKHGIKVSYTPDAPAPAVAELTFGMMLSMLRSLHLSNAQMHQGQWYRHFGRRLEEVKVGIIGVGRVGMRVLTMIKGFTNSTILVNDIIPNHELNMDSKLEWTSRENIFKKADIISIHIPLNSFTKNLIRKEDLFKMKKDAVLINTSRGGIINEADLYEVLKSGHLGGAAIDVFEQEPYEGPLRELEQCLLTAHMGSMSVDCRTRMEIESTEEAIRFLTGKALEFEVPQEEYELQSQTL